MQFRNQYTIAKNLHSSAIVQTYSLEAYQNGYALVMEDFGGISLKDYFAYYQTPDMVSLEEFLLLAIALCDALDILIHPSQLKSTGLAAVFRKPSCLLFSKPHKLSPVKFN